MSQIAPSRQQALLARMQVLSPQKLAEVEDFVEFLVQRTADRELVAAARRATEPALAQVWDNPEDAVYDDL